MELRTNMYVRTNTGIRRVVYINDGCITFDDFMSNGTSLFNFIEEKELDMYLTKEPSYRIIDLIEVGDYVNGREVIDIKMKCDETIKCLITKGYDITNEMIKSIVTKEQFKANEYVVE